MSGVNCISGPMQPLFYCMRVKTFVLVAMRLATHPWPYLCCGYFAHSPFQVLHNGQIILYNIAPLSSEYLIPCLAFSTTFSSYICKYAASEDVLDSNITVESQINSYWAQQSKVSERVLNAHFQTLQPMHTYDFLIMVYSFRSFGLLNDSFRVKKSIICTHTHTRSIINSSLLGVNIEVTDQTVISCQVIAVSFLACKIAIFVLLMVLQFTPVNSCMVWLNSACIEQDKIQKALALQVSSIPWHLVSPPVVLMLLINTW